MSTTDTDQQVRLASIVAIDVAKFSTMSERDQKRAARSIESLRARIETVATRNGGRVFNTAGDGFMLEFPSAGAALSAINELLDKRPRGEVPIRVGAHVGDVVVTITNDLLGHGVNVAARLQALATPNSALVSGEFRSMARNSPSAAFQAKGRQPLENIDQRVQTYAILSQRQRLKRVMARVGAVAAAAATAAGVWFAYPHVAAFARSHGVELRIGAPNLKLATAKANTAAPRPAPAPSAVAPAPPQPGDVFRDCAACPEMIVVPAGGVQMGSAPGEKGRAKDEGPQHSVSVPTIAIGRNEITFAEWDSCANDGGCGGYYPADNGWGRGTMPAVGVSWNDAQAYVAWLNAKAKGPKYRLLTESEWEYAARGGESAAYSTGAALKPTQARYAAKAPAAVGSFAANQFGLFDTAGNAAEWVADCYAPYDAVPDNACAVRVHRGGSFADPAALLRSAARGKARAEARERTIGFRVARALEP